jgi:hypothetical protein
VEDEPLPVMRANLAFLRDFVSTVERLYVERGMNYKEEEENVVKFKM